MWLLYLHDGLILLSLIVTLCCSAILTIVPATRVLRLISLVDSFFLATVIFPVVCDLSGLMMTGDAITIAARIWVFNCLVTAVVCIVMSKAHQIRNQRALIGTALLGQASFFMHLVLLRAYP
jgi:hypothetical protein